MSDRRNMLSLPKRTKKIRDIGITHVLDKGTGIRAVNDLLEICKDSIDIVKLGWGTSIVTENLREKIDLYMKNNIHVCLGGTLLEVFITQNKLNEYLNLVRDLGLRHIEISNGIIDLDLHEKLDLIKRLSKEFTVLSEVGSKDTNIVYAPSKWVEIIKAELDAGSFKVITEGRESGTVGVFRQNEEIRTGLIEEIILNINPDNIIFEAPKKHQQAWFIKQFDQNVNLGNIAISDVIPLETLRLGLRGDTFAKFHS